MGMEGSPACPWQPIVERLALAFPTVGLPQITARVQSAWALFDGEAVEASRLRAVEWMVASELGADVRT
jgi:hypothetical protein